MNPDTIISDRKFFLKSGLNFEYFEKKDDPQSFCISAIMDSENVVR